MPTSESITRGIRVHVESSYIAEESNPQANQYFFAYRVTIANEGSVPVQLISRHWIISDAEGVREEVKGLGVIGEQPVLAPGESHQYTSFCPLKTTSGKMEGSYQMVTDKGEFYDVQIAPFDLAMQKELLH